jgi:hypothetical protein
MSGQWIRDSAPGPAYLDPYIAALTQRAPFDYGAAQERRSSASERRGSMSGRPAPFPDWGRDWNGPVAGDLPKPWQEWLVGADYVVWSYETPIAWHLPAAQTDADRVPETWCVPDIRYSQTTEQHQLTVLGAVNRLPEVASCKALLVLTVPGVDPGEVRRGYGHSPYGPRRGGW